MRKVKVFFLLQSHARRTNLNSVKLTRIQFIKQYKEWLINASMSKKKYSHSSYYVFTYNYCYNVYVSRFGTRYTSST